MTSQTCMNFNSRQNPYFGIPNLHASQLFVTQDMDSIIGSSIDRNLNFIIQKIEFKNIKSRNRNRSLRTVEVKEFPN